MGLHVLLVGKLRPDLGTMGMLDGLPVADIRHLDAVQSAAEEFAGSSGALFVTCQTSDAADVRHALAQISVALPRVTTVLEPLPGPPLAVAVGSALVGGTSSGPEQQLTGFDRMRTELWSAVWLPKVGKLAHPPPTLAQHAGSWLPGGGFLAIYDGEPRVRRAAQTPLQGLESAPRGALLVAADSDAPDWVRKDVAAQTAPLNSTELRSWRNPVDAFGTSQAGEFVLIPDPLINVAGLDATAARECRGCGWGQPRLVCPFCGMATDEQRDTVGVYGGIAQ